MMRRLLTLAVFLIAGTVIAFIDVFGNWALLGLAVIAWGVYFALIRRERRA